jgi:hypothetical protein
VIVSFTNGELTISWRRLRGWCNPGDHDDGDTENR